jgi:predicted nucleotidyltransferase
VDVLVDFEGPATFDRYVGLRFYLRTYSAVASTW